MRIVPVRDLGQWMYEKRAPFPGAWLAPMRLPGLRVFWPGSCAMGTGGPFTFDLAGARLTLGSGTGGGIGVDITTTWPGALAPYVYTAGGYTNGLELQSRDEFEMAGSFTLGCWVKFCTATPATQYLIRFRDAAGEASTIVYWLDYDTTAKLGFTVKNVASYAAYYTTALSTDWHLIQGRFTSSTSVEVRVDAESWASNTTGIPANHQAVAGVPHWMALDNPQTPATYMSQTWLCAGAVGDTFLNWLYYVQKPMYGRV